MSNVILFIWLNYWGYAQSLTWHGDREDREREKCHPHCKPGLELQPPHPEHRDRAWSQRSTAPGGLGTF